MKELGLNKTELARRMNVSRPYVAAILSRDVNITFRTAAKLAKVLQMDFAPELGLRALDTEKRTEAVVPKELLVVAPERNRQSYSMA